MVDNATMHRLVVLGLRVMLGLLGLFLFAQAVFLLAEARINSLPVESAMAWDLLSYKTRDFLNILAVVFPICLVLFVLFFSIWQYNSLCNLRLLGHRVGTTASVAIWGWLFPVANVFIALLISLKIGTRYGKLLRIFFPEKIHLEKGLRPHLFFWLGFNVFIYCLPFYLKDTNMDGTEILALFLIGFGGAFISLRGFVKKMGKIEREIFTAWVRGDVDAYLLEQLEQEAGAEQEGPATWFREKPATYTPSDKIFPED